MTKIIKFPIRGSRDWIIRKLKIDAESKIKTFFKDLEKAIKERKCPGETSTKPSEKSLK